MTERYSGKAVALLTQHGKETLIGSVLEPTLGCAITLAEGFDTDQLGSFSGEIKRLDTQLQTARQKARIGMDLTGLSLGIASEGSFGPDPFGGLIPWNIEILIWIDDEHQLEIVGMAQGPALSLRRAVTNLMDLEQFAHQAGFPNHHLMLRPQSEVDPRVMKGLDNKHSLQMAFEACQQEAPNQTVFAENDLRAFCNPTRQSMIRLASEDLLIKIQAHCPVCVMPGFAVTGHLEGLPCSLCGSATKLAKSYTWRCSSCNFKLERLNNTAAADPSRCDFCNP